MRIMIITEEEEFYLPLAVDKLLKTCNGQVLEVVCARNPLLPGTYAAAKKFLKIFGFWQIFLQGIRLTKVKILDLIPSWNFSGRHYSIKSVCKAYDIPYSYCENLNETNFMQHCKDLRIELIASVSPTQIFKEPLINLPKYGCINIHTAKLPKYRGLYPTYWAMACGEKTLGVCVHYIEQGIDTGKIILQDELDIPAGATLDYMLTVSKLKGAELILNAIKQIEQETVKPYYAEGQGSYFSFPTRKSYKEFKRLGYKLW